VDRHSVNASELRWTGRRCRRAGRRASTP